MASVDGRSISDAAGTAGGASAEPKAPVHPLVGWLSATLILAVIAIVVVLFAVPTPAKWLVVSALVVTVFTSGAAMVPDDTRGILIVLAIGAAFGVGLVLTEAGQAKVGVGLMAVAAIGQALRIRANRGKRPRATAGVPSTSDTSGRPATAPLTRDEIILSVLSGILVLSIIAAVVVFFAVSGPAKVPALSGLVVTALTMLGASAPDANRGRFVVLGFGTLFGTGLVLGEVEATAIVGLAVVFGAIALFPIVLLVANAVRAPLAGRAALIRLVVGVSITIMLLGVFATIEAGGPGFAIRYGTPVTASVGSCSSSVTISSRTGVTENGTTCTQSTWTMDGVRVGGTVHAGQTELGGFFLTKTVVDAYAIGTDAFTQQSLPRPDWFAPYGFLPGWLAFAGLALIPVIGSTWLRRRRAPSRRAG